MRPIGPGSVVYDVRTPLDSGERFPNRYRVIRRSRATDPVGAGWWLCLSFASGEFQKTATDRSPFTYSEGSFRKREIWMDPRVLRHVKEHPHAT